MDDVQKNWNIADEEGKRRTTQVAIAATTEEKLEFSHNIPIDVAHEILLRLPVKSLLRFKAVCKSWLSLISDPLFKKSHVNLANNSNNVNYIHLSGGVEPYFRTNIDRQRQHSVGFTSIVKCEPSEIKEGKVVCPFYLPISRKNYVLGSCDGLLLVSQYERETFLWNPSTGKRRTILRTRDYAYKTSCFDHVSGLGYDSSLRKYKAIIFFLDLDHRHKQYSHLFICGSGPKRYRKGEDGDHDHDLAFKIYRSNYSSRHGFTVGGAPHWIYASKIDDSETLSRTIVYFDMVEEKFKNLPTPTMSSCWNDRHSLGIAVFEGCLCIVEDVGVDKYIRTYNVWAMKEYGVKESWTKLFVIGLRLRSCSMMPLRFSKNGDELVLLLKSGVFLTYNLNTGKDTITEEHLSFNLAAAYVESLVLP